MKSIYIIPGLVILAALISLIAYLNKKQIIQKQLNSQADTLTQAIHPKENAYPGLRRQMLTLTPELLQLNIPKDKEIAFGAVLEMGSVEGTATIVSLSTGDASMYTSTGGGMIGGLAHENVKNAAIAFVAKAQDYYNLMQEDKEIGLPKAGDMKFFILTNKKRYSVEVSMAEVMKSSNRYFGLFDKGNDVITQLRSIK